MFITGVLDDADFSISSFSYFMGWLKWSLIKTHYQFFYLIFFLKKLILKKKLPFSAISANTWDFLTFFYNFFFLIVL